MTKNTVLSLQEMEECIDRIGESSFEFIKEKIADELHYLNGKKISISVDDVTNITLISISKVSGNIINMAKNAHERVAGEPVCFDEVVNYYLNDLSSILKNFAEKHSREKMN